MKPKVTPTHIEHKMAESDFIVSKTDLQGRITYTNRIFMRMAGYEEHELLNVQHNIIRHPDMPRAVFQLLWDTIKTGAEFNGYVKNMCKNGDYYWVFANVTPSVGANGKIDGYYSVRRCPRREAINTVVPIYQEMLALEKKVGPKEAIGAATQLLLDKLKALDTDYEHFVLEI